VPPPRYLVGIDFSPGSRRALAAARQLAARTGANLTIAHVRPTSDVRAAIHEERGDLVRTGGRVLVRDLAAHYEHRLGEWARERDGDRTLLLRGAPDVALAREARRGYALLVLGSHGANALASVFLGSNVERALARSPIPVLIAPALKRR
jgi:nucleotide-binding universal stress UspA family protein